MKSWLFVVLAGVLLLAGCGTHNRTESLQQEKLLLDLTKTQSDQLAQLLQMENDLRGLENKNQEALREIERQRAALQAVEQESARKDHVAQAAIAQEKARLQAERDAVESEKRRLRTDELKNQASEREIATQRMELSRLRASVSTHKHVEIEGTDVVRRSQEQKAKEEKSRAEAETAARVNKRQPYLEQLAAITANFFDSPRIRSAVRTEVLDLLNQSKVADTKEDDAFVDGALEVVKSFYLGRTRYPFLTFEKKAYDQWGQEYLKAEAATAMANRPTPHTSTTAR